ncbi:DUF4865 family protein [Pseudomonas sp. TE3610]
MIAMQYSFSFPQGHDMSAIARRVAEKGHLFDDWPHLVFKAFLMASEKDDEVPASENLYAPFYLWANAQALVAFLASAAFAGVSEAFGRPTVNTWLPVIEQRKATLARARFVTREIVAVDSHAPLAALWIQEQQLAADLLDDPRVEAVVTGIDPAQWSLVRMVFRRRPAVLPLSSCLQHYRLLHLSQPTSASERTSTVY